MFPSSMSNIQSTQLYKGGADGQGSRREGRGLLTCFDLPLGTLGENCVVRCKHIDVQAASFLCTDPLFTLNSLQVCCILFVFFFSQVQALLGEIN